MKKLLILASFFIFECSLIQAQLFDCVKSGDKVKEDCALDCIKSCPCTASCEQNYVLTDCMERCDCAQTVKKCIDKCDQIRSDITNECINHVCLDPWCACPSCGMNF